MGERRGGRAGVPGRDGGEDGDGGGDGGDQDAARTALNRARSAALARGHRRSRQPGGPPPADRRGPPDAAPSRSRASGAGPDGRDPQPVAGSLGRLVTERGWDRPVAVGGVLGRWRQVVGDELDRHCRPERFEDGVLTVRADSSAWAAQVRLLGPTVLRRLAEDLGEGVVGRLVVRGPSAPSWRAGPRVVSDGRGPRDTYG